MKRRSRRFLPLWLGHCAEACHVFSTPHIPDRLQERQGVGSHMCSVKPSACLNSHYAEKLSSGVL